MDNIRLQLLSIIFTACGVAAVLLASHWLLVAAGYYIIFCGVLLLTLNRKDK